jgi:hypothetical protein
MRYHVLEEGGWVVAAGMKCGRDGPSTLYFISNCPSHIGVTNLKGSAMGMWILLSSSDASTGIKVPNEAAGNSPYLVNRLPCQEPIT